MFILKSAVRVSLMGHIRTPALHAFYNKTYFPVFHLNFINVSKACSIDAVIKLLHKNRISCFPLTDFNNF